MPTTYAALREKLDALRSVARRDRECPCCGVDPESVEYVISCLDDAEKRGAPVETVELINGSVVCGNVLVDSGVVLWHAGEFVFLCDYGGSLLQWMVPRSDGAGCVDVEPREDGLFVLKELDSGEEIVCEDWRAGVPVVSALASTVIEARQKAKSSARDPGTR